MRGLSSARRRTGIALIGLSAVGAAGCPAKKPEPPAPAPIASLPLAGLAGQRVLVLPAHFIRADTIGWAARVAQPRATLAALDSAIERVLGERGFRTSWVYPDALARSAKRNAGYVADPYALAADRLRPLARTTDNQLREPLASQMRGLVALNDARYAVFPVELRFEPAGDGLARPVVRVVLIDARLSTVRWQGDVRGEPGAMLTPAMLDGVASSLANLVSAP